MVKQKLIGVMPDNYKANLLPKYLNATRITGIKAADKPLASTHWIESPDTLQAFTHGLDSNSNKIVQVALPSRD